MKQATKRKTFGQMTDAELAERYRHFKEELFTLRFQKATQQLEKNHRLRELRRDIARVLTYLEQREAARAGPEGGK